MAIGSQDDADYLVKSTRDVDALLWVTPPGYGSDNVRAFQNRLGKAAATAIRTNRIGRVVNLSSIGAELNSGVGLINGLHDVEGLLDEAAEHVTHLRPGFFFENLLLQVDSIRQIGRISLPISGSRRYPMIAARDIGRVAADCLASETWTGESVRELHGPADLSLDEVAGILSEGLGRKVEYVRCDRQQSRQFLLSHGVSENFADLMLEMYDAVEAGWLHSSQPRSLETTTPTALGEFAQEVMLPMLAESAIR
jgi:uncharacterized protein YbjT (DUF2867 family)